MRVKPRLAWFLAFVAAFAALAGFVFWGTWSLDACPVMPDARMTFPVSGNVSDFVREWIGTGRFTPWDVTSLLGSPYFWQELQYAIAALLAAAGLAYYLRGRGLSRPASYGAGLLLGFCGYWLTLFSAGHAGWFRWMLYGVFAFGLADRAVRKGKLKNWLLLGACIAWASFYQPDLWFLFTAFTGIYFVWCCVRERKLPDWKGVVAAAAVFFAIGAPSFIHAFGSDLAGRDKQIEESKGTSLSGGAKDDDDARWIFVTNWSLPPEESLEFFLPRVNGDTSCQMTLALGRRQGSDVKPYTGALGRPYGAEQGNYRQHSLYVGWVTCLLSLLAVVVGFRRRRGEILFFFFAGVVFWLFSMGRYCSPVYRLVYALPFGDYLRAPVKWHHLTELCLCVLAGFGLDALLSLLRARGVPARIATGVVAAVALFGACDLARIDRLYCAVVDLTLAKSPNPAADEVLKRGGGKVADLVEGGGGFTSWSFSTKRVDMTGDVTDPEVRFIWAGRDILGNRQASAWLKAKEARPVGSYVVTQKGIKSANGHSATAILFELPGVTPKPSASTQMPPVSYLTWLGVLSLATTVAVLGCAAKGAIRLSRR